METKIDLNIPAETQQKPSEKLESPSKKNLILYTISGIFGGITVIMLLLLSLNYFRVISLNNYFGPLHATENENKIIAKVGKEFIYQKDLDTEIANFPRIKDVDIKKLLLVKIEKDSVILQAGQAEGLVKLDDTVFNSPQKDYGKRIALVAKIKTIIQNRQDTISGSVISIWFYNDRPGAVGYEKGKEIALRKITGLYNDVKAGKITMKQAAQKIINDSTLADVDTSYKSNALWEFNAGPSIKIVYDPAFEAIIRNLQPGQVSSIYVGKDADSTGKMIDAVYMFAQVTDRTSNGHPEDFDHWVAQKQKNYEISTY